MRPAAFAALAAFFAPLLALIVAGFLVIGPGRRPWATIAGLVGLSTVAWLVFVGLFEYETCSADGSRCPTVYGYDAPLAEGHPLGS